MRDLRCFFFGHEAVPTSARTTENGEIRTDVATCVNCGMTIGFLRDVEVEVDA